MYPTPAEVDQAAKRIATILHETCCRYDHTDGCSWELYDKDWTHGAHADWLRVATFVLNHAFELGR